MTKLITYFRKKPRLKMVMYINLGMKKYGIKNLILKV